MTHLKFFIISLLLSIVSVPINSLASETGQQIMEEKCTLCHDIPTPEKLTKEEWIIQVNEMAPNAGLSEEEAGEVLDYVSRLSRDVSSVLTMPNEKRLFEDKCSLCHTTDRALIMPMTPASVKEIVKRMKTMAGDWISENDAHEIEEYLTHGAPGSIRPSRNEIVPDNPYALFLQRCTSCHNAEQIFSRLKRDKEGATTTDWPDIISRMQQKAPEWITHTEADIIIKFMDSL